MNMWFINSLKICENPDRKTFSPASLSKENIREYSVYQSVLVIPIGNVCFTLIVIYLPLKQLLLVLK